MKRRNKILLFIILGLIFLVFSNLFNSQSKTASSTYEYTSEKDFQKDVEIYSMMISSRLNDNKENDEFFVNRIENIVTQDESKLTDEEIDMLNLLTEQMYYYHKYSLGEDKEENKEKHDEVREQIESRTEEIMRKYKK